MNYSAAREKAIEFMLARHWKEKTGKLKQFNQSLFDHALVVLDTLIALLPLLRGTFVPPLTDEEEQVLIAGVVAHDVGKELDDWQEYVHGRRGFLSDVNRQLAEDIVPQLVLLMGFTAIEETVTGVLLHMSHERTPARVMDRVLFGEHENERWKTLSDVIAEVDNLGSAKGLFEGLRYLEEQSIFSRHVRTAYHLVQMRGVSTTMLHRAAIDAFIEKGWSPVLHYSSGTLYAASAVIELGQPTIPEIQTNLAENIKFAMGSEFTQQVVGNPIFTILPKPELFDYREVPKYLETASKRVTTETFSRRKDGDRLKAAARYLSFVGVDEPDPDQLSRQVSRIGRAYPEMSVFAFFKAMLREGLLGDQKDGVLKEAYEGTFGNGTFDGFEKSSSQLSPAKNLKQVIDPYWRLSGSAFGLELEKVEFAPDATRQSVLVNALSVVASRVYAALPETGRPTRAAAEEVAKFFIGDLLHPASTSDLSQIVAQQLHAYAATKANARRDKGVHLCPICNTTFDGGTVASADFLANPESHTNRAVSHGNAGYIVICDACKFERFLQQVLLGDKVSEVIVLFPRMNVGHSNGELLRQKAARIWDAALNRMSEANPDPDQHLSLGMTYSVARKLVDQDIFRLSPKEIVELITYQSRQDTQKRHRKELADMLKELYDADELSVELLNDNWGTNYTTSDEALEALLQNKVADDDARKTRATAFHLAPQLHIACQTPNLILVPLANPISMGKDSDTNAGIRELYIILLLGLALDCSVAVMRVGEVITFEGGEGVARVPPIAALRAMVGTEWLTVEGAKRWFDGIGAAAMLANATAFPESSNLYSILKSPTAGHILRRIEQKSDSGQAHIGHLGLLEKVKEVLR